MQNFLKSNLTFLIVVALTANLILLPSWEAAASLIVAMAMHAACVILIKAHSESGELSRLKAQIEATSQEVKHLKLKIGFK